jgi:hypothetical protein
MPLAVDTVKKVCDNPVPSQDVTYLFLQCILFWPDGPFDYGDLFVPLFARRRRLSYIHFSTLILCHRALWVKEDGSEKQVAIKRFQDTANLKLEQNHLNRLERLCYT